MSDARTDANLQRIGFALQQQTAAIESLVTELSKCRSEFDAIRLELRQLRNSVERIAAAWGKT